MELGQKGCVGERTDKGAVGLVAGQSNHTHVQNVKDIGILVNCPARTRGQIGGKDLEEV